MGKAYLAPRSTYQRSFYITSHVLDRLRLRSPDSDTLSDSVIYRPDSDLMNRIDEAIKNALAAKNVHHVWDAGEPARIVWVSDWFLDSKVIYILLKRDAKNERMWAAVTVFTESQFENNKRNQRWKWSEAPHPDILPMKQRFEQPAAVSIKPLHPVIAAVVERRPLSSDETILFYYRTKGGADRFERYSYKDSHEIANKIIERVDYEDGSLETYSRLRTELKSHKTPIDF